MRMWEVWDVEQGVRVSIEQDNGNGFGCEV